MPRIYIFFINNNSINRREMKRKEMKKSENKVIKASITFMIEIQL